MASDRSHLVRTTITDRRGRATTVYRRSTPASTGAVVLPPQIRDGSAEAPRAQSLPDSMRTWPTSGRFRNPKERTIKEIGATLEAMERVLPGSAGRAAKSLRRENARHSTQLAMEFIDAGVLSEREALLTLSLSYPEDGGPLPAVALRVAAVLRDRVRGDRQDAEWIPELVAAVRGATSSSKAGWSYAGSVQWEYEGAKTQPELDSLATNAEFILRVPRHNPVVGHFSRDEDEPALFITPAELDDFLRDRPQDLHRIIDYVTELGFDRDDPDAVNKLRAHLDSDTPTGLLSGWL